MRASECLRFTPSHWLEMAVSLQKGISTSRFGLTLRRYRGPFRRNGHRWLPDSGLRSDPRVGPLDPESIRKEDQQSRSCQCPTLDALEPGHTSDQKDPHKPT